MGALISQKLRRLLFIKSHKIANPIQSKLHTSYIYIYIYIYRLTATDTCIISQLTPQNKDR